jgi:putative transposase
LIASQAGMLPVRLMCRAIGVSRSGYYASQVRPESQQARENRCLTVTARTIWDESRKTYGSLRIHAELRARGIRCSRNRVVRLMQASGIRAVMRRRYRYTADSRHDYPVAPNRLERSFLVDVRDRVWATDTTYIWTESGWLHLAVVLDLHSRRVIGWALSGRNDGELTAGALEMALGRRRPQAGLLHHSDQGSQYACFRYQRLLREHGLVPSMSRKGNPYDNAVVESFFKALKVELVYRCRFATREEATAAVVEYIESFYNCRRRHSALGYLSPAEYEEVKQ